MLLSVYMPHSGYDEEDYIKALEMVRDTLTEGRRAGAVDFFIAGDLNIELLMFITIHLFQLRLADTEQYFLRHQPFINWRPS